MSKFLDYLSFRKEHLIELTIEHAQVVAIALLIATAIGIGLGVAVYLREAAATVVLGVVGTLSDGRR